MPIPGQGIFSPGWSAHHQPTAETAMTDTVRLQRSLKQQGFDGDAGASVYPDPVLLDTAPTPARVQRMPRRSGSDEVGDRPVEIQLYQVSIPVASPELRINDQVRVTAAPVDPTLVGKVLRIREFRRGSQLWERDLLCEEVVPMTR